VYGLGGEDLTAIFNAARRRNRSFWDVVEELTRQPGLCGSPRRRGQCSSGWSGTFGRYTELAHERPAGEVRTSSCVGAGCFRSWRRWKSVAAEEALQNIARFFDIVRSQSDLLPDDRVVFVGRPPADAHRRG